MATKLPRIIPPIVKKANAATAVFMVTVLCTPISSAILSPDCRNPVKTAIKPRAIKDKCDQLGNVTGCTNNHNGLTITNNNKGPR